MKKTGHASHDKVMQQATKTPGINTVLKDMVETYLKYEEDKKLINKAQREIRAKAKEEHGILSSVWSAEIRMRKMDPDVRIQYETGLEDFKVQLGHQFDIEEHIAKVQKDPAKVAALKVKA